MRLKNHQLRFFKMPSCLSFNGAMVVLVAGVLVLVKMVRMVKHGGWVGLLMGAQRQSDIFFLKVFHLKNGRWSTSTCIVSQNINFNEKNCRLPYCRFTSKQKNPLSTSLFFFHLDLRTFCNKILAYELTNLRLTNILQ